MRRPTPDDYGEARKLFASALDATPADGYHHDHDEEFEFLSFNSPPLSSKPGSLAYWLETGSLVREYLMLQAGDAYDDALRQRFVRWLRGSPAERRRYIHGDDMQRAALVDWFLKVVR
jgi:hypothetical protein